MKSMWELHVQKQFYYHIIKISILAHIAFFFYHKYKITHSWCSIIFGNEFPKSINNKILKNRFMCNITFSLWSLYSDRPYPNFWNLKENSSLESIFYMMIQNKENQDIFLFKWYLHSTEFDQANLINANDTHHVIQMR